MDKLLCVIVAVFAIAGIFNYWFFVGAIITLFINACVLIVESFKSES